MRTLGDLNWINDYVGKIPYKFGGRDWDGVDCYGLAKLIYKEHYNIDLPDWVMDEVDLKTRDSLIAKAVCSGDFTEVDDPMDGDFVVCSRTRMAHHLGLFYAGGVLHGSDNGVVYEPLSRFSRKYVKVIFGKWEPS